MADDPRIEAGAQRLMMSHPSWFKRLTTVRNRNPEDAGHADAMYAARMLAEAVLKGADPADGLRDLLADEDRAVETLTRAWRDGEFGAGSWDRDVARGTQARQLDAMRPVLAALREVSGL